MNYTDNPFQSQGARLMTLWTLRLATDDLFGYVISHDPHMFALFYAAAATAVEPPDELIPADDEENTQYSDSLLPTLKDLQKQYSHSVSGRFAQCYLEGFAVHQNLRRENGTGFGATIPAAMREWKDKAELEAAAYSSATEQNVNHLAKLVGLSEVESSVLLMQLYRRQPGFSQLFDALMQTQDAASYVIATMLGVPVDDVINALQEDGLLASSGLLRINERPLRIEPPSEQLRAALAQQTDSAEQFAHMFVKPLRQKKTTSSVARLDDRDRAILIRLMQRELPQDHGLHVLVYGPSSVDKADLVARAMAEHDIPTYVVNSRKVKSADLPAWTYLAQKWIDANAPESVLVIDKADRVLTQRQNQMMVAFGLVDEDDEEDRDASDEGLISSVSRCVWLTDNVRVMSEDNLGRFLFHCEAMPGSRSDRRQRVAEVVTQFSLSKELEQHLAQYSLLGEKQVHQAARLAEMLHEDVQEREPIIKRAVFQAQRVLARDGTEGLRQSVTKYSLDNLNVAGKFTPEMIIKALKRRPHGAICFHGLPGSGKTQLAEYMAVELDMPIIMRRASELLDKYVGENEKNAASMFAEAEAEGAILFLDEADSFLRERANARAEWSVSLVNEMLQSIERFPGIFIAATNLMNDVDAAAMRRFTWKLEFLALKPDQAWQMFLNEAEPDLEKYDASDLKARLASIADLTPGDFAVIKRQVNMLGEEMDPDEWLEQLAQESKAKMHGLRRNGLGFAAG
jgi:replication-associated recombination protein RarA